MLALKAAGVGFLFLAAPLAGQQLGAAAAAAVDAFHRALRQGDSATALALLAPDVVVYESGTPELSREEYRTRHLGPDMAFEGATTTEVIARRGAEVGEVAWVVSQTRTTGRFRERDIDRSGVETVLLRRTSDGWRIVHIHWSSRR